MNLTPVFRPVLRSVLGRVEAYLSGPARHADVSSILRRLTGVQLMWVRNVGEPWADFQARMAPARKISKEVCQALAAGGHDVGMMPISFVTVNFPTWTREMAEALDKEFRRSHPELYPQALASPPPAALPPPPAPAVRGMLALSGPQQPAADTDPHDDDFADDVVVGPNPGLRTPSPVVARPRSGLRAWDMAQRQGAVAEQINPDIFNGGTPNFYQRTDRATDVSDLAQAQSIYAQQFLTTSR